MDDTGKAGSHSDLFLAKGYEVAQMVGLGECKPLCAGLNYGSKDTTTGEICLDATTEESLHLIQKQAFVPVYPKIFKDVWGSKSSVNKGLDTAR